METTIYYSIIWICSTVFSCILVFKIVDYYRLKAELKHKIELEKMRLESRKKNTEIIDENEKTKQEIEVAIISQLEGSLEDIVSKKLDNNLCERIKKLEDQLNKNYPYAYFKI